MKYVLLLTVVLLLLSACTVDEQQDNLTLDFEAEVDAPQDEMPEQQEEVPETQEETEELFPDYEVNVINGGFETSEINFADTENPEKVGYQYSKYYLSPYDGEATMRVIVSVAKKNAFETPTFKVFLDKPVLEGQDYRLTFYVDDIKGSWYPAKAGFGESKYADFSAEKVTKEYSKVTFDMTADTTSSFIYIYFDGTTPKEFKLDNISIQEI